MLGQQHAEQGLQSCRLVRRHRSPARARRTAAAAHRRACGRCRPRSSGRASKVSTWPSLSGVKRKACAVPGGIAKAIGPSPSVRDSSNIARTGPACSQSSWCSPWCTCDVDLPAVQSAARLDGLDVQQRLGRRAAPRRRARRWAGSGGGPCSRHATSKSASLHRSKCMPQRARATRIAPASHYNGDTAMFTFDPYSPAVDADPFPFYKTLRDEHPCFWSHEAQMWILSRYADIVTARAGLADLFLGQGQPDDRAAQPRRRDARHHRSPAPRPPARPGPARLHEAQPRERWPSPIRDIAAGAAAELRASAAVRLHRGLLVQVHRARAVRRARPAAWATRRRCATRPC